MAKATKNSQNRADRGRATPAAVNMVPELDSWVKSRVPAFKNTPTRAISMAALPKMVNIRNFMAEYSLRPLPHTEMSMYMGTSSSSQKRKNSSRSKETNTPMIAVCKSSSQAKYSRTRIPICHDAKMAQKPSNPVSSTSGALRPSTAIR